jgi:hypothetical protein
MLATGRLLVRVCAIGDMASVRFCERVRSRCGSGGIPGLIPCAGGWNGAQDDTYECNP